MYIHRVILKDVPGIPNHDLTFFDEWTDQPLQNVLLTGPNGTGKTTLLRVIAGLWDNLSNILKFPQTEGRVEKQPHILRRVGLAAIEIHSLIDQPFWLYTYRSGALEKQVQQEIAGSKGVWIGHSEGQFQYPDGLVTTNWFRNLAASYEQLRVGLAPANDIVPNMIHLETETRLILPALDADIGAYTEPFSRWLVTYSAAPKWEGHIEGMLRNLKVRNLDWFKHVVEDVNNFLRQNGKELTDFDVQLRLYAHLLSADSGYPIAELSAGEQQCLILIFMVSRWLMEGGVVLIDEPDLHIHGSWLPALIHDLEKLVGQRHGQLIITSHSPFVIEEFSAAQRFHLEPEPQHS